jgi:hypothetical protein
MLSTVLPALLQYALPTVLTALGGVATAAMVKLTSWLHSKEQESKLARVTAVVADTAQSVVAELDATLRPQLEAAMADGVLTDAESQKLKSAALEILKNKLPANITNLATKFFGAAVDTWIAGHIERAVNDVKLAGANASDAIDTPAKAADVLKKAIATEAALEAKPA